MKEWRVIIVLLSIIVLFSVILGIKIINNTPEKQIQDFKEKYTQFIEKNEGSVENNDSIFIELEREKISMNKIDSYKSIMLVALCAFLLISLLLTISGYKICFKLEINSTLIWGNIALHFISGFMTNLNFMLGAILMVIDIIIAIIIIIKAYKTIGVNPLLLLLGFIPYVGSICMIVIFIDAICKLANYFNKGTGFKLGLIFLPFIFLPILAFSSNE